MTPRAGLSLIVLLSLSCTTASAQSSALGTPRSIIFLIADGAGSAHFTAGRMIRGANFQTGRLPYTGLVATSPLPDSIVTDSAAAATQYASGVRPKYRYVGVDASGKAHPTVLELAEKRGKATGLVTTANFWDATVAAFAAHTASRYESARIIKHMLGSGVDLLVGGGLNTLGSNGLATAPQLAEASGYALALSLSELESAKGDRILGVFPTEKHEADFAAVRLPVLARLAIDRLSRDRDGFFLVIEHEGTDGASHNNATDAFIRSMISFDEAVGVALEYAATREDVLVVVTSDHETGGLQIHAEKGSELKLTWATGGHTGEAIPIFAKGPGAEQFVGFLDGEEVGRRLLRFMQK